MILSVIYQWNHEATYYLSSISGVVCFIIMAYMSTWKNAKQLGKTSMVENEQEMVDVEKCEKEEVCEKKDEVSEKKEDIGEKKEEVSEK